MTMTTHLAATAKALFFVLLALLLCGVIFEFAGYSAPLLFYTIAEGAFLSSDALMMTLRWALPLAITSVGVLICFRSGYMNIGAQGQFYFGAILAAFAAEYLDGLPAVIVIPGVFLAGVVGGALWSAGPGLLKVRFGTDEVITTLMANFVAALLVVYVTSGPLKDPSGSGQTSASRPVAEAYRISDYSGVSLTIVFIALAVVALSWVLMNRTAIGIMMRVTGRNPTMALWQGARLSRIGMISCLIGGGLAGLSGSIELLGPNGRLVSDFQPGHGFTAVLIALVAGGSVMASAIASVFFGGLAAASLYLPIFAGLPASAINMINGAIAVFITARTLPAGLRLPTLRGQAKRKTPE
jgi:ABC-type uncharacterized transport system permease subunit